MTQQERLEWDERFRTGDHASADPDPFLTELGNYSEWFPAGRRALDIACGAGRNAVDLAAKGWDVTGCDLSLEGLRKARALASERGVRLTLFCQDLETISLPPSSFDLVACFFYLYRPLFPSLKAAVRPRGFLVYKTYTTDQQRFPGRPRHPAHMLKPQELLEWFEDWRVLFYQETVEGRGVAQIIAQKPQRQSTTQAGPSASLRMTALDGGRDGA